MKSYDSKLELHKIQKHHQLWFLTNIGFLTIMVLGLTDSIIDNYHLSSRKLNLADGGTINEVGIGIILGVSFCLFIWVIHDSIKFYKENKVLAHRAHKGIYIAFTLISLLGLASSSYEFSKVIGLHHIETSNTGNKVAIITLSIAIVSTLFMLTMNHIIGKRRLADSTNSKRKKITTPSYFKFTRGIVGAFLIGASGATASAMVTKSMMGEYNAPTIICYAMIFGLAGLYLFGGSLFKKHQSTNESNNKKPTKRTSLEDHHRNELSTESISSRVWYLKA